MCKHLVISALVGKRVTGDNDSAIKKQLLFCNHLLDEKDFSIFTSNNDFKVNLTKNCLILLKRASNLNFLITKEEIFTV